MTAQQEEREIAAWQRLQMMIPFSVLKGTQVRKEPSACMDNSTCIIVVATYTDAVLALAWSPAHPDLVASGGQDDIAFLWRVSLACSSSVMIACSHECSCW